MSAPQHRVPASALEAIARSEAGRRVVKRPVPLLTTPHAWPLGADITLVAPDDQRDPILLVWDPAERGWRVVLLPPGSTWRIHAQLPKAPWLDRLTAWLRGGR